VLVIGFGLLNDRFVSTVNLAVRASAPGGPAAAADATATAGRRSLEHANLGAVERRRHEQNIGQDWSILLILALGITYIILMGAIDLSVGSLLGLGEVVTAVLLSHIGYLAFVVATLVGLAAGLVNGLVHVRLQRPHGLRRGA
jgi:hypothetical protein